MPQKTHKIHGIHMKRNSKNCDIKIDVDFGRFEKQLDRAQYLLDSSVMQSMVDYMPSRDGGGGFVGRTVAMSQAIAGTGRVVAAAPPYGRFLYEGKKMEDSATGKGPRPIKLSSGEVIFRFRKGAQLQPTTENLDFEKSIHPEAQAHWFEKAKEVHGEEWVEQVKRVAGGGDKKSIID